jgi:hypothetical protein
MAGKTQKTKSPAPDEPILPLVKEIRDLVQSARRAASQNVNTLHVITNFEIGRRIVEFEQQGSKRAAYEKQTLIELSIQLNVRNSDVTSQQQILSTCAGFTSTIMKRYPKFPRQCLGNCQPKLRRRLQ